MSLLDGIRVVLLDIEGTTTPITFVTDTLFPYARKRLRDYIQNTPGAAILNDVRKLKEEHDADIAAGNNPPSLDDPVLYLEWLMDQDRKSPSLKAIQGKIWKTGYEDGSLKGVVYTDVPEAMQRWRDAGKRLYIYSSGSVLAQKLLFGNTEDGNLLPLLDGHFDTAVGGKKEADSYRTITEELDVEPAEVCFFSDIIAELDAAHEAGLKTVLVCRDELAADTNGHELVKSFEGI